MTIIEASAQLAPLFSLIFFWSVLACIGFGLLSAFMSDNEFMDSMARRAWGAAGVVGVLSGSAMVLTGGIALLGMLAGEIG